MSGIKFHGNSNWYDPCLTTINVYKDGAWRPVVEGVKYYYNGQWLPIICTIYTGEWIENTAECEILPERGEWIENTWECQDVLYLGEWVENTSECIASAFTGEWIEGTSSCDKETVEQSTPTAPSFGNIGVSNSFKKEGCPAGSSGTFVEYNIEPNVIYAPTQTEADELAIARLNTEGQANANESGSCLANDVNAVIVVDIDSVSSLNACGYIDTIGVAETGIAYRGFNFYLPTDDAKNAYVLASDVINTNNSLKWRFQFNIAKLLIQYPLIDVFKVEVRGRSSSPVTVRGRYSIKGPEGYMAMSGILGRYIPTVINAGNLGIFSFTSKAPGGANGTFDRIVGAPIISITYNRITKAIQITTY